MRKRPPTLTFHYKQYKRNRSFNRSRSLIASANNLNERQDLRERRKQGLKTRRKQKMKQKQEKTLNTKKENLPRGKRKQKRDTLFTMSDIALNDFIETVNCIAPQNIRKLESILWLAQRREKAKRIISRRLIKELEKLKSEK